MPREWTSGICSCCAAGVLTCCISCFCYPLQVGLNASKINESCLLCCCPYEGHLLIRSKLRAEHGIGGSLLTDCLKVAMCGPCAVIQEANEISVVYTKQPI